MTRTRRPAALRQSNDAGGRRPLWSIGLTMAGHPPRGATVLETWEADDRLSWTNVVLLNRARETVLPVWTRNHRDFIRYDLPNSAWPVDSE